MKDSKSIKDLKNINTELSTILEMFVKKVAQSDSFEVESWLKKNNFNAIADIRLLQKKEDEQTLPAKELTEHPDASVSSAAKEQLNNR